MIYVIAGVVVLSIIFGVAFWLLFINKDAY
jgi:hypothetical protein